MRALGAIGWTVGAAVAGALVVGCGVFTGPSGPMTVANETAAAIVITVDGQTDFEPILIAPDGSIELTPDDIGDLGPRGCTHRTLVALDAIGDELGRLGPGICPSDGLSWRVRPQTE